MRVDDVAGDIWPAVPLGGRAAWSRSAAGRSGSAPTRCAASTSAARAGGGVTLFAHSVYNSAGYTLCTRSPEDVRLFAHSVPGNECGPWAQAPSSWRRFPAGPNTRPLLCSTAAPVWDTLGGVRGQTAQVEV